MPTGLPINTFVKINTQIAAGGVLRTEFGTGLIVTQDAAIAAGGSGKMRLFANFEAVNEALDAGAALDAGRAWFSADPAPHSLYIGRWATAAVNTEIVGAVVTVAATAAPFDSAAASFRIGGQNVTAVSLVAATTYAAIATALETAIQALGAPFASATVTYDATGQNFTLDLGATGAITGQVLSNAVDAMGAQVGTDISAALGLDAAGTYRQGHDAESLVDAIGEMLPLATGGEPALPMLAGDCPSTLGGVDSRRAVAGLIQAGDHCGFIRDNVVQGQVSGTPLETNETASFTAWVADQAHTKVWPVTGEGGNFSPDTDISYPDIAANALLSSQRLNLPAQIVNPNLKSLPGADPLDITDGQLAELKRKGGSVYTRVGGLASLADHSGPTGGWADAQYWLLWLKNEMELNIFNSQRASRRFNTAIMRDVIGQVMAVADRSGGLQPGGKVSASVRDEIRNTFNAPDFDGILQSGWLLWVETPTLRSDADRENRLGRFTAWVVAADALNEVLGTITLSS